MPNKRNWCAVTGVRDESWNKNVRRLTNWNRNLMCQPFYTRYRFSRSRLLKRRSGIRLNSIQLFYLKKCEHIDNNIIMLRSWFNMRAHCVRKRYKRTEWHVNEYVDESATGQCLLEYDETLSVFFFICCRPIQRHHSWLNLISVSASAAAVILYNNVWGQ